jgi:nicotinamidase-related amidase
MRPWETVVPEFDRQVYEKGGFAGGREFGRKPALLVIDVVESWTGSKPQSVLEAIEEYKTACGASAWEAMPKIRQLLDACREADIPVIYTLGNPDEKIAVGDSTKRARPPEETRHIHGAPIPEVVAPREGEFQLVKPKASAFFGTPLVTYLTQRGIDHVLVTGTSTSGCVQASVNDGHAYGFKVFVVEECVFDRSEFLHNVYLYNMNAKYADVITLQQALDHVATIAGKQAVPAR